MRINVVPVQYLSNVHLRAEYREVLMAPHYYRKSSNTKTGINRSLISDTYILNKGHAMMWYNKMGYILRRHDELEEEMIKRGYKTRELYSLNLENISIYDFNDYTPTKEDFKINVERIMTRIKDKPHLYKELTVQEWEEFYRTLYN